MHDILKITNAISQPKSCDVSLEGVAAQVGGEFGQPDKRPMKMDRGLNFLFCHLSTLPEEYGARGDRPFTFVFSRQFAPT